MPFVGDVFGLNTAYDLQVSNIEKRNVLNWPEYPTYGYFVGGTAVNAPTQSSTITRLDLATNVGSLPGRNLPAARIDLASVSNNFYGYIAGGILNTLVRLDFANETSSIPGKNFTANSRSSQAAVSNLLYGYFGGGYAPGLASIISRLEFSSETVSNPGINFSPSRARFAAVSSSNYGYFGGGYTPTLVSTITRLDFTNETLSLPTRNLPTGIGDHSALSNISYGYFGGGTGVCTINRLDFSNETISLPGKNLPTVRRGPLAFSDSLATGSLNGSYGYFGGGGIPTGSGMTDVIERIDFVTENINTLTATIAQQRRSGTAFSNGGSSFRTNSKTYGYFGGGYQGFPVGRLSTITRLDFSTENLSVPGNNISNATERLVAMSNNSYGYLGGGVVPFFPTVNYVYKLDFSNEISNRIGDLPTYVTDLAAVSSNVYGYFAGGYRNATPDPLPALYICTITRLDFSNDTINNPGRNLLKESRQLSATSSNFYGYFGGGYSPEGGPFPIECKITRLDFSNETATNPTNNFSVARYLMTTTSNNSYGYFVGGWFPYLNTITRLDFSNETLSNPGKNFPVQMINSAATSNNFYGYFGGGLSPTDTICTITRLDFSTENLSVPGKNFPATREKLTALSNSN